MSTPRTVLVLGSTGSVGTQALDVIRRNRDRFQVVGLGAGGRQLGLLKEQAAEFDVKTVAVANGAEVPGVRTLTSMADLVEAVPADVVLNAMDGSRGLEPSLMALETGATLALANKESLIAGGPLVLKAAKPGQIVPVDSEHSALAQCLRGGTADEVHKLVLTASGGPFRGKTRKDLEAVTVQQAMAHPTWSMGQVVTINSANLVNKGLELIEAHLLFGVPYDRVDVVVHPQSIIHSMVTFTDGSTLAQASPPDMRLPISLGLSWPERVAGAAAACTFDTATSWTFEPLDSVTFPAVELARQAGTAGGCLPAIYNAANEEALASFVAGHTSFLSIVDTIGQVLGEANDWQKDPADVAEVLAAEDWARARARELVGRN
ncbi:1-deoxy-D-xylulose 5-phosphate reductoisomerase [Lentzea albidocapillata subsp. violacea]|uniref:1-deoxy-D-xylulose 5-phosphate reductoisomerase n=1 Tax=Lentzea albidocapillata subsp. violacea TaxID=128104 RepID=A0A1G9VSN5_9PSEU|nr:1-deoxy-D-xylulose-5-phosphate reductoisomerase [Lentzea albidocapillata]SDM74885.1 1-deoxy-D-xylulose 5-phosphate reductoisomerase [Lentzea albidocapillata subsp. violacea]